MRFFALLFALIMLPVLALAQASLPTGGAPPDVPYDQTLSSILTLLGGVKSATALSITALIVQIAMKLLQAPLGNYTGKLKLIIISGLTMVGALVGELTAGVDWKVALFSGAVLTALQVFVHQIVQHFKPTAST